MFTRISDRYQNSTAIVIGAGGIGGAIVQLLSGHVSKLVVGDRDQRLLDALAPQVGTELIRRRIDVSDAASVREFFAYCSQEVGSPQFLFYTAGILNLESLADTTPALWETAVDVNLNGAFYCTHAAMDLMIPQKQGSILLLGSIAGTRARSGSRVNPVYNTTKAAVSAFVNAAAMQLRPHGVRINCISPGPTATAMMDLQPKPVHAAISEIALDRRQNTPAEVAELALFVAAHGRFTGEDLGLGGGAGLGG
ncbi:MAG: short-chain dehydrogenase/reductase [Schlesneria sp.]|nr:short-chain dehydrogenase/reductase [Schlesneria sp.]